MAIRNYFYDKQLRSYLKQFAAIFTGLQVLTGKGETGEVETLHVPIIIGSRDRVVAAIAGGNTTNRIFPVPIMSAWMSGLELAPERRKGVGQERTKVFMPQHGVYPDDLRTVQRIMPIPYNMMTELSIYASNTDQLHQMVEQILILFDPMLQIQTNDKPFDWTRLTQVELQGINNEENYPAGTEKRTLIWSFNFVIPIWLSPPMAVKDELVRKIVITLGDMDGFNLQEVDEYGQPQPFDIVYGPPVIVTERKV